MRNIIKSALIIGSLLTPAVVMADAPKKDAPPPAAKDAPKTDAKTPAAKDGKDAPKADAPKTDATKTPAAKDAGKKDPKDTKAPATK